MRSKNSLLDSAVDPIGAAAADEPGILEPPRDVKRQIGDGVDVDLGVFRRVAAQCCHAGL